MKKRIGTAFGLIVVTLIIACGVLPAGASIGSIPFSGDSKVSPAGEPDNVIPHEIDYQGYLARIDGMPLNGDFTLVFSLYDEASGGVSKWNEKHKVHIEDGLFKVVLGSFQPIPAIHLTEESYLGIQVENDNEMTPRHPFTSVAYAMLADQTNNTNTLDGIDSGDLVHTAGDTMTGPLQLPTNGLIAGSDQLVLANGCVGIGTTQPAAMLDVRGDVTFDGDVFRVEGADTDNLLYVDNISGTVGIGMVPSGDADLEVDGTVRATAFYGDASDLTNLKLPNRTTAGTFFMKVVPYRINPQKMDVLGSYDQGSGYDPVHLQNIWMPYSGSLVGITISSCENCFQSDKIKISVVPVIGSTSINTLSAIARAGQPFGYATQPANEARFGAGSQIGVTVHNSAQLSCACNIMVTVLVQYD